MCDLTIIYKEFLNIQNVFVLQFIIKWKDYIGCFRFKSKLIRFLAMFSWLFFGIVVSFIPPLFFDFQGMHCLKYWFDIRLVLSMVTKSGLWEIFR